MRLASLTQKKKCLQNKKKLSSKPAFRNIYLRGCEDHASRLNRLNINTLLHEMKIRGKYRLIGSGRLVKRDPRSSADASYAAGTVEEAARPAQDVRRSSRNVDNAAQRGGGGHDAGQPRLHPHQPRLHGQARACGACPQCCQVRPHDIL